MSTIEDRLLFQMRAICLPVPEREFGFHKTRRWRFDFAWPEKKLAVEVEGGTWAGGRHVRPAGFEQDCEKYGEAAILKWSVLRVTSKMVNDGRALQMIERALIDK